MTLHVRRKSCLEEKDSEISELSSKRDTLDMSVFPEIELSNFRADNEDKVRAFHP